MREIIRSGGIHQRSRGRSFLANLFGACHGRYRQRGPASKLATVEVSSVNRHGGTVIMEAVMLADLLD